MPKKKLSKKNFPTLKDRVVRIGIGVTKLLEIIPSLATKEDVNKSLMEIRSRLIRLEENKADKEDMSLEFQSVKADIAALKEIIIDRYMEVHGAEHKKIEQRIAKLETAISI